MLCYYAASGFVAHLYLSLATGDQANFTKSVVDYFECEYYGDSETCKREHFEQYIHPSLNAIQSFMAGLFPVANLMFVVNWRRVGQILKRFCGCFQKNVHEVEVEDVHSTLSPHPDSVDNNSSTFYENSIQNE